MKFRKKPAVIEAVQYDGTGDSFLRIWEWACPSNDTLQSPVHCTGPDEDPGILHVQTLEGEMKAQVGDWIIKGVNGEFYPCKPDIFAKTYEPEED